MRAPWLAVAAAMVVWGCGSSPKGGGPAAGSGGPDGGTPSSPPASPSSSPPTSGAPSGSSAPASGSSPSAPAPSGSDAGSGTPAPGEQPGSSRWARTEGHIVDSVSIGFGHFAVLVDGGILETWSTAGDKTSSAEISQLGNDDTIVAGPSFVLVRRRGAAAPTTSIALFDWSGTQQRLVGGTDDYGQVGVPAVSGAARIAWTDVHVTPEVAPPPTSSSLHVEDADGSNLETWTSTDAIAGSVTFDPQGDVDVVVHASGPGSFFGRSFGASGPETALVQLDPGGNVRWTRDLPFSVSVPVMDATAISNAFPAIGTTDIGTIALAGEGHFVAVERVDGAIRFDVPADGNLLAVDPKGRAAIAGGDSVAYYDLTGARQWSRSFGSGVTLRGVAIADDGSVVVVGSFQGTVDFGTGPLTADPGGSGFLVDLAP